jgi:DDE superfamily endonuclease
VRAFVQGDLKIGRFAAPSAGSTRCGASPDNASNADRDVLKDLADLHFTNAKTIVLVQDNLNIHSKASLYEAFPAAEARRLVERFEWHYTPKHGSWLDLAESELGILSCQCLDRCIPDKQTLIDEVDLGARPKYPTVALHNRQRTDQTQAPLPFNLTESSD